MAFLLIMVATGWVCSELKRESVDGILKRVHFPERERERERGRSIQAREEKLREAEER